MVILKRVAALGGSGIQDWFAERLSAVVLAAYTLFWLFFWLTHPGPISYLEWKSLFQSTGMRIFTLLSVLALCLHVRVGMWVVLTDYVKSTVMRMILNLAVLFQLILFVYWTVQILWGV